jgi:hypothetical protein
MSQFMSEQAICGFAAWSELPRSERDAFAYRESARTRDSSEHLRIGIVMYAHTGEVL